jgi:hypothetical protein
MASRESNTACVCLTFCIEYRISVFRLILTCACTRLILFGIDRMPIQVCVFVGNRAKTCGFWLCVIVSD